MKTPFERFADWRLALRAPAFVRAPTDMDEQHRWDGEGGNRGMGMETALKMPYADYSEAWRRLFGVPAVVAAAQPIGEPKKKATKS